MPWGYPATTPSEAAFDRADWMLYREEQELQRQIAAERFEEHETKRKDEEANDSERS